MYNDMNVFPHPQGTQIIPPPATFPFSRKLAVISSCSGRNEPWNTRDSLSGSPSFLISESGAPNAFIPQHLGR